MMEELVFSCNWGNDPEKAWSGTSMGLYRELEKRYVIERLDIRPKTPLLLPLRCMEKLGLGRYDMVYMKYYSNLFERKHWEKTRCKVFQFDECPNVEWADSFIYQDLSVSFLMDVYEHNRELIPYVGLENLGESYLRKRLQSQNAFYKKAAGIFTMGKWLADYLVEQCGLPKEKVHAVGGGINVDASQIDDSQKKGNKFLFVGRDFKRKGGDMVVKAFQLIKKRNPEAELYIAGPAENPLQEKDRTEGIVFLGEQGKSELNMLYNKCDIFCMPSRFEAYGLVFPEALTYGLPCIGRDAFSMKEFIQEGQNGYLLHTDTSQSDACIQELADKMSLALHDQNMKAYVRNRRDWYIREYSWKRVVERIVTSMEDKEGEKYYEGNFIRT